MDEVTLTHRPRFVSKYRSKRAVEADALQLRHKRWPFRTAPRWWSTGTNSSPVTPFGAAWAMSCLDHGSAVPAAVPASSCRRGARTAFGQLAPRRGEREPENRASQLGPRVFWLLLVCVNAVLAVTILVLTKEALARMFASDERGRKCGGDR